MFEIPDAYDLWEARDREHSRWLERLPKCCCCQEPIQQEMAFCLDDHWVCDDCIKNHMEEVIEDGY